MSDHLPTAAAIALLRSGSVSPRVLAEALESGLEETRALLGQAFGLLARSALDPIIAELKAWRAAEIAVLTPLDPAYPANLRTVHDRPPLLFARGELRTTDQRAVAVIGTRAPSDSARRMA